MRAKIVLGLVCNASGTVNIVTTIVIANCLIIPLFMYITHNKYRLSCISSTIITSVGDVVAGLQI